VVAWAVSELVERDHGAVDRCYSQKGAVLGGQYFAPGGPQADCSTTVSLCKRRLEESLCLAERESRRLAGSGPNRPS
jgi:hypothetical protein